MILSIMFIAVPQIPSIVPVHNSCSMNICWIKQELAHKETSLFLEGSYTWKQEFFHNIPTMKRLSSSKNRDRTATHLLNYIIGYKVTLPTQLSYHYLVIGADLSFAIKLTWKLSILYHFFCGNITHSYTTFFLPDSFRERNVN